MVKQQRKNKKGERDVQGCDVDQSQGDAQGVMEGKKKEEKTHGGTVHVCVPVCAATEVVRSVKKKKRVVIKVEIRQWRRPGTDREQWEVQLKPQRPCAHCNFTVLRYFYGNIFLS